MESSRYRSIRMVFVLPQYQLQSSSSQICVNSLLRSLLSPLRYRIIPLNTGKAQYLALLAPAFEGSLCR